MGITGYLQIYNDWSRLEVSLRSLSEHVDEIVVVDGAYDWMKQYVETLGWHPERSEREVYDILDKVGIPYRVIQGTWRNEIEKRTAGYNACRSQYALRIDADEVLTFDDAQLSQFLTSDYAVAAMRMHLHVTPDYVLVDNKDTKWISIQTVLFDKQKVSAEAHLNYIFLVLTADALPEPDQKQFPTFPQPIASCSHLSLLRHPRSALLRGSYYHINWMRAHGVGWIPNLRGRPLSDTADLFREIAPEQFRDIIMYSDFVAGWQEPGRPKVLRHSSTLTPSELSAEKQGALERSYTDYLTSLTELNACLVDGIWVRNNSEFLLDATTEMSLQAIAPMGVLSLECDEPVKSVEAKVLTLHALEPWQRTLEVSALHNSTRVIVDLSTLGPIGESELRRAVFVKIEGQSGSIINRVKIFNAGRKSLDSKSVQFQVSSQETQKDVFDKILESGLFNSEWYVRRYPDFNLSSADPLTHYIKSGANNFLDPSPYFSTCNYLFSNPDVFAAGINPLFHFIAFGHAEGRKWPLNMRA